jgi:hypothetical protein
MLPAVAAAETTSGSLAPVRMAQLVPTGTASVLSRTTRAFDYSPAEESGLPGDFHDVTVRIETLHAHIVGLIPLPDDHNAVSPHSLPETADILRARQGDPEMEEPRHVDGSVAGPQSKGKTFRVVEHKDPVRILPWRGIEAQIGRIETPRPFLIADGKCKVVHGLSLRFVQSHPR